MTSGLLSGLVAGYGIAIPVGAIGVLIITIGAHAPRRISTAAALGTASADGVYALVAVLGGAAVAAVITPIATPLRFVAAGVLLVIATRTGYAAIRHHRDPARAASVPNPTTAARTYATLGALTLLNPATVIYFAALVLGHRTAGSPASRAFFVLGAFVASASWQLLLAAGGSALGRWLGGPLGRLITALVSSALVAALAVRTLID